MHEEEAEQAQRESRSANARERSAQEFARVHLRPDSVLSERRVHYQNENFELNYFHRFYHENRPPEGPQRLLYDGRFSALKARRAEATPHRYEDKLWQQYRSESIRTLSEYYPKSKFIDFNYI